MPRGVYLRTKEYKKQKSEAMKKYFSENPMSDEWCKHISERLITREWRSRISRATKGQRLSSEHRRKIGIGITGRPVSTATREKISSSLNKHPVTMETRKRISTIQREQFRKGQRLPNSHAFSKGWFRTNSGTIVRSSWELFICNLLTELKINWLYEPQVFDLGFTSYRPDLYLPEYNIWIEIKGYWWDGEKAKVDVFSQTHPLLLIDEAKYNQIKRNNSLIVRWLVSMR